MKKYLLIVPVLMTLYTPVCGQYNNHVMSHKEMSGTVEQGDKNNGFYFRLGFGYAIPQAGQASDPAHGLFSGASNGPFGAQQTTFDEKKASFAAGLYAYAAAGYMFNRNIGVELSAHLGIASKKYVYEADNSSSTLTENDNIAQSANIPVILNPAIVIQTGGDFINFYSRFGIALPVSSQINDVETYTYPNGPGAPSEVDVATVSVKTNFSVGMTGAFGVNYKLGATTFYTELNALSLSLYTREFVLKAYSINGASQSVARAANITPGYSGTFSPTQFPSYSVPFSNFGLSAGVIFKM